MTEIIFSSGYQILLGSVTISARTIVAGGSTLLLPCSLPGVKAGQGVATVSPTGNALPVGLIVETPGTSTNQVNFRIRNLGTSDYSFPETTFKLSVIQPY